MKTRLVIFDFDGTLADSFGCFLDVADALADRHRFARIDRSDLNVLRGLGAREMMKRQGVPFWKLPLIARDARALAAQQIDRIQLFEGMAAALGRLAARSLTLALVTSNSRDNVLRVLGPANASLLGELQCGVSLFGKARCLRRLLKRTGVPAVEALFIGDEIRDARAARAAGIAFGAVGWGFTSLPALRAEGPACVFERVADLPAYFDAPDGAAAADAGQQGPRRPLG